MTELDPRILARLFGHEKISKGERRKFQMVEACIACLCEGGLAGASYETVAIRLGIGRSHVAYHFPEFRDLLETSIRYITETAQAIVIDHVQPQTTHRGRLRAYVDANFEWARRHPDHIKIMVLFGHLCGFDGAFEEMHTRIRRSGVDRLKAMIEAATEDRKSPLPLAPEALARTVHHMITGTMFALATSRVGVSVDWLRLETMAMIEAVLGSLADPAPTAGKSSRKSSDRPA
jgi:AcrR family transcriptional regulator